MGGMTPSTIAALVESGTVFSDDASFFLLFDFDGALFGGIIEKRS